MNIVQPEPIDTEIVRDIAADMRGELDRVQEQMAELTREHRRAQTLNRIFVVDPLTRDRFNPLHANIDQFAGKLAELQEEERLLTRWLDRCRDLLERKAAWAPPALPGARRGEKRWRREGRFRSRAILSRGRGAVGGKRAGSRYLRLRRRHAAPACCRSNVGRSVQARRPARFERRVHHSGSRCAWLAFDAGAFPCRGADAGP